MNSYQLYIYPIKFITPTITINFIILRFLIYEINTTTDVLWNTFFENFPQT